MTHPIRLAMVGMIPGNGHPYSWSAIINGYDPTKMETCPYVGIPKYLGAQPLDEVRIPDAAVTHIWTDNPDDAVSVAAATYIPNIVTRPEDVIAEVDAVIISTDDGTDHVRRARPFVAAGLPVFIDKPLATTVDDLAQFASWHRQGARLLSSSGMRYAPEIAQLEDQHWRWITSFTCKTWERYGIHALEPVFRLLGPGFLDVRTESQEGSDIVYTRHQSGSQATLAAIHDAYGSFGAVHAYGAEGDHSIKMQDTYSAFRGQLVALVDWLRSGADPYPFSHTLEMMAVIIAGQESRQKGGNLVPVESILKKL